MGDGCAAFGQQWRRKDHLQSLAQLRVGMAPAQVTLGAPCAWRHAWRPRSGQIKDFVECVAHGVSASPRVQCTELSCGDPTTQRITVNLTRNGVAFTTWYRGATHDAPDVNPDSIYNGTPSCSWTRHVWRGGAHSSPN